MLRKKRFLIITLLSMQTTVALAPAFAQDSPGYTPDIISVDDIYTAPTVNEVPTAQIPKGLGGIIYGVLGDDNPNTINETQRKFLKVFEYGQKALKAYRLGKDLYQSVRKVIKDPDGVLKHDLLVLLDNYNKIGGSEIPSADAGGNGPAGKIFDDPQTPDESYIQAKNDVARRMYVPSLMQQLVFGEDARKLREQQSSQLEESLTNTIEASTNLVQLTGGTIEAVAHNGDLAKAVGEESTHAQTLKSSQAVLKSLARSDAIQSHQTSLNGVILGNIQQSQGEQNKATTALVVSSALAYQQRDVGNHQLASQSVFLEQIRADFGQQEDERRFKAFANLEKQANATNNVLIPGLVPPQPQTGQ